MPQCSIIGCGSRRGKKPQHVTIHRLPLIESKRKAWLEIIGSENIDTARKYVFVCSLHFEESCFNRTMNIIKLRDDAVPSPTLLIRTPTTQMLYPGDRDALRMALIRRNIPMAALDLMLHSVSHNAIK